MSKPHIDDVYSAPENLKRMLDEAPEVYDRCISTLGFAYHFGQIVNKAIVYEEKIKKPDSIPACSDHMSSTVPIEQADPPGEIYDLRSKAYQQAEVIQSQFAEIQRLREENGRLREALEYYADNDKWFGPEQWDGKRWFTKVDLDDCSPVTSQDRMVGGKRARKALGKESK